MKNVLLILSAVCLTFVAEAQTWNQIQTGTTKDLFAIDFPSANVGYIGGDSSSLFKSIDGGQSWAELSTTGISNPEYHKIVDIDFISETTGYISLDYGGAYLTFDGGFTWYSFGNPGSNMCYSQTIYVDNQDHLFFGGAGCFQGAMIDEYDAGTWNSVFNDPIFWDASMHVEEISFGGGANGIAAVHNEYVLRTTDGGTTWDSVRIDLLGAGAYLTSVKMVDNLIAYAGYNDNGAGFGILKTIDGGLTWTQDINSATFYYPSFNCVQIAANGDIYSGTTPSSGPSGVIFESIDGINWTYETVNDTINEMASYGDDVTFAVGNNGYLVVNVLPGSIGINEVDFESLVIFPNPVQDELSIPLDLADASVIQVFTTAGKQVQVNINKMSGLTTLDVSGLAKGIYILKIDELNKTRSVKFVKK